MFLIIFLYMLFASTFTIGKAVLSYANPIFFIGFRMILGGLALLGYLLLFRREQIQSFRKDLGLFAQVAFFQFYASFILEFWSLQYVTSSKSCLLFNLSPFITALISFFLLKEYFSTKKFLGLTIGFLGFMPILMAWAPEEQVAGSVLWLSFPELALLGAVFASSYGWIVLKKTQDRGYRTLFVNGATMLAAGIVAFFTSLVVEGAPVIKQPVACYSQKFPALCELLGPEWAGIAFFLFLTILLVIIANIICFNLYGYLLNFYSTTFLSFAGFITPLFAAFFGWLFLDEIIGLPFIASVVMVSIGLLLFYQEELKLRES